MKAKTIHTIESLLARAVEEGECFLWQGYAAQGVPQIHHDGKMAPVRRVMWELMGKKVVDGFYSTKCHSKDCVNPRHIVYRSREEHIAHMNEQEFSLERRLNMTKARRRRDDIRLSEDIAKEIRMANGNYRDIGSQYGVTKTVVSRIKRGVYWADSASPWAGLMR